MHSRNFAKTPRLQRLVQSALWLCGAALWMTALACGGDSSADEETPSSQNSPSRDLSDVEGLRLCCQLGSICHPDADDPIGGTVRRCHELGHSNQPAECRAEFDACAEACDPEGAAPEHVCL